MKYSKCISLPLLVLGSIYILGSCQKAFIGNDGEFEEDIYLNYQTKTDLKLPFQDQWYIFHGGKTHHEGGHHFITWGLGQRYAIDIVIKVNGKSYIGNGNKNEDYHCFGKPLYAPGTGKIIEVENNIDDNIPGEVNENEKLSSGNYVMIDHFNGEYSILAHIKKGTVIVSEGDTVVQGQKLGETGNSGNSTEAHLHYQLQNSSNSTYSTGLPAQFRDYYADGKFIRKGELIKGQIVRK
ncbi:M23 family metallopeptidase [bacterium SCSIO 12643]|nr:M23 family metallopeptidase [bacterium SCSIO 12643]